MAENEVDAWFAANDPPNSGLMRQVRKVMLNADRRLTETIKWSAPTFTYKGNLASFNPRAKKHVSLMFHSGATITGDFPSLQGEGPQARSLAIVDADDLAAKTAELKRIVAAWCDQRDGET